MTDSIGPLLRRRDPWPDESLPSLLIALTEANGYDSLETLRSLCLGEWRNLLGRPYRAQTYTRLAELAQLTPTEIHAATIHHFAPVLTFPNHDLMYVDLPSGERLPLLAVETASDLICPESDSQFCPACLAEAPVYHRRAWMPIAATVCLKHRCLLVRRCPWCSAPLPIEDILQRHCPRCDTDLARWPSLALTDPLGLFAQEVLQGWLGTAPLPPTPWAHTLPDAPPRVLYRVLEGLRWSISWVQSGWRFMPPKPGPQEDLSQWHILEQVSYEAPLYKPPAVGVPSRVYLLYTTAFKALLDWPANFRAFLDAYSRLPHNRGAGLSGDFGVLFTDWLEEEWRDPAFDFVQEAFNQYLVDRYAASSAVMRSRRYKEDATLAARFRYVTVKEASQILEVSFKVIPSLVEAGYLEGIGFGPDDPATQRKLLRTKVEALRTRWQHGVTLTQAARWLGLSEAVTLDLVALGLLRAERGPTVEGSSVWMFLAHDVETCLATILGGTTYWFREHPDAINLTTAAKMLTVIGVNAARALLHVAEGKLPAHRPAGSTNLKHVCFREGDVRACVEARRIQHGWVTRRDIARRMGVKFSSIARWVRGGLLTPVAVFGAAEYYASEDVDRFVAGHVFTDTAARILGVTEITVQRWTRAGLLTPVSGPGVDGCHRYLFRREDLARTR